MADTPRWWVLSDPDLKAALHRVAAGEDPDLVHIELYVNSEHENVEGDNQ